MTKKSKQEIEEIEVEEETKEEESKTKKIIKEIIPYVVILVVVIIIRTFFVTPIIVSGDSMNPTLKNGEMMILNKQAKLKRFSIVVVDIEKENIIKRIIALPGETISCEKGVIYVNDRRLEEEYGKGVTPDFARIKLADDEYFVLGDNRENSLDSQELGPFKENKIKGATNFIIFPFNNFGKVK